MKNRLFIITGLSGAGKSLALKALEDIGFFCIDNMPAPLIMKLLDIKDDFLEDDQKIACVVDIRNAENNVELFSRPVLKKIWEMDHSLEGHLAKWRRLKEW